VLGLEVKSEEKGNQGRIFHKCPARKVSISLKFVMISNKFVRSQSN
jgi:hypothetical protein